MFGDIGLDNMDVLETCDNSIEVVGSGRVPDDRKNNGIWSSGLKTKE